MATIKGQNLRIAIDDGAEKPIAAATNCTVHIAMQVQDSSTKDSADGWVKNEVVGMNWDMQVDALILSEHDDEDEGLPGKYPEELVIGQTYDIMFAKTSSTQNRDFVPPYDVWVNGKAVLSDLQFVAQNRNNSTYSAQFTGVGELEIPEDSEFNPENEQEE